MKGTAGGADQVLLPLDRIRIDPGRYQNRQAGSAGHNPVHLETLRAKSPNGKFDVAVYESEPLDVWWNPEAGAFDLLAGHHKMRWAEEDGFTQLRVRVWSEAQSEWKGKTFNQATAEEYAALSNSRAMQEGARGKANEARRIDRIMENDPTLTFDNALAVWEREAAGRRRSEGVKFYNYSFVPEDVKIRVGELEQVSGFHDTSAAYTKSVGIASEIGKALRDGAVLPTTWHRNCGAAGRTTACSARPGRRSSRKSAIC